MFSRYKRALSELIHFEYKGVDEETEIFEVIGTTGNPYQVKIGSETKSECTCQDHQMRRKLCKHIMCILIKHYRFNLVNIRYLENNPHHGMNAVFSQQTTLCGDACPICLQEIENVEFQCYQCEKVFHSNCISDWFHILQRQGLPSSCPMCRNIL